MSPETLEDHLRRATRSFTARLPEDEALALGRELALEVARAHGETPPRHPELDPSAIPMEGDRPRLDGGTVEGDVAEDLLTLGALLQWLTTGETPEPAWRLDGPPEANLASIARRGVLAGLASPRSAERFASAAQAAEALASALRPEPALTPPWPLFRGDASRSGVRAAGPAIGSLGAIWEAAVGGIVGSPALTAGLVVAPVTDGRLVFLDRATGRRAHEVRLGAAIESSPALGEGLVVLGTDGGEVVALDLVRGREVWRVAVGRMVRSSPLLHAGRVFVGVVDGRAAGAILALEARTGKSLWRRKLGPVFSSPALAGATVVIGSDDGSVHALDSETGALVWSHALGGRVRSTPAMGGDLVFVSDFDGRLVAVRLADGSRAWGRELGQPVYSSVAVSPSLALVGCHDGRLRGLRPQDGEPLFELSTRGPIVSSPLLVAGQGVVASTDGELYVADGEGRLRAQITLARDGVQSTPAVDGDVLFVGSARGLHAVRLLP